MSSNALEIGLFLGTIVRSAHIADAQLSMVRHDRPAALPEHGHEAAYFCLLLHGSYTEYYQGKSIEYRPFMLSLHPPRYTHSDTIGTGGTVFFVIELDDVWMQRLSAVLDLKTVKVELRGSDMVWLAMRIFKEFSEGLDADAELHIESLLYELIAAAARVPEKNDRNEAEWLRAAVEFLDDRFAEQLSMKTIADIANVHPVTLARAFRKRHQQTVSEYINRVRVRHASELLLGSDANVCSIALDCGFIDQSYFTKVFRNITGTTPARFRQTLRRAF